MPSKMMHQNQVLEVLKASLTSCKLEKLGKRVQTHIEKSFPDNWVTVYSAKKSFESSAIRVWYTNPITGNSAHVEVRVYERSSMTGEAKDWRAQALVEIERQFSYDTDERARQEEAIFPALSAIEEEIKSLQARALMMIEALPIPSSATVRKDSCYWDSPSRELTKRLPATFPR